MRRQQGKRCRAEGERAEDRPQAQASLGAKRQRLSTEQEEGRTKNRESTELPKSKKAGVSKYGGTVSGQKTEKGSLELMTWSSLCELMMCQVQG